MPFCKVRDDLELFYTDEGTGGTPMLLVHGWACDSHDWGWQIQHFAQHRRVIAVDNRGHGASTVTAGGYEAGVIADDIALLLRELDVPRVIAVGHSLGGLIISALAVEYPDLVESVVAIEPSYGYAPEDAAPMIALSEAIMTADNAPEVGAALCEHADGPNTPDFFKAWHRRRVLSLPPHVVAQAFAENWTGLKQFGVRAQTEAYLARRVCPSLTVYAAGHEDQAAWAAARARAESDEALYLPLGHWAHQEAPGLFNSLIDAWLQRSS